MEGFTTPAYLNENNNIVLLNGNVINVKNKIMVLDFDMIAFQKTKKIGEWTRITTHGLIDKEVFQSILLGPIALKDIVIRDDLEKVVVIFREDKKHNLSFQIKIVPSLDPHSNYQKETEIGKKTKSTKLSVDRNENVPVPIRIK